MNLVRIGVIEIGSRSVRYLVIDVPERMQDFKAVKIANAEHHIDPSRITSANVDTLNSVVGQLCADLLSHSCDITCVYGTALCRSIETMYPKKLSTAVRTLSTEEEAMAAWAAGFLCQDEDSGNDTISVIDLGNGSTEIVRASWNGVEIVNLKATSVSFGSSRLIDIYKKNEFSYMKFIEDNIPPIKKAIRETGIEQTYNGVIYVTGSAATKIGWQKKRRDVSDVYRPHLVNGVKIKLDDLTDWYTSKSRAYKLNPKSVQRTIDPRRCSEIETLLVLAGAPYIWALVTTIDKGEEFFISGYGTRHGMAYLLKHGLLEY